MLLCIVGHQTIFAGAVPYEMENVLVQLLASGPKGTGPTGHCPNPNPNRTKLLHVSQRRTRKASAPSDQWPLPKIGVCNPRPSVFPLSMIIRLGVVMAVLSMWFRDGSFRW